MLLKVRYQGFLGFTPSAQMAAVGAKEPMHRDERLDRNGTAKRTLANARSAESGGASDGTSRR